MAVDFQHKTVNRGIVSRGDGAEIEWAIVPHPTFGIYNGYVKIPEDHPWFEKHYDDIPVQVHGGLTYGDDGGWIGFDTAHLGDYWPDSEFDTGEPRNIWTLERLADETKFLAEQVLNAYPPKIVKIWEEWPAPTTHLTYEQAIEHVKEAEKAYRTALNSFEEAQVAYVDAAIWDVNAAQTRYFLALHILRQLPNPQKQKPLDGLDWGLMTGPLFKAISKQENP